MMLRFLHWHANDFSRVISQRLGHCLRTTNRITFRLYRAYVSAVNQVFSLPFSIGLQSLYLLLPTRRSCVLYVYHVYLI